MSSNTSSTPPARSGLSLYANLLDPSSKPADSSSTTTSVSISRAPVLFNRTSSDGDAQQQQSEDVASVKKQQINAAALRFQPTKRPQNNPNKSKAKSAFIKVGASNSTIAPPVTSASAPSTTSRAPTKTTLADWTGIGDDDDVNGFYSGGGEKRQRGGRKKRKKNNKEESAIPQNWDDIYDPSRPNNYEEYKNSDEKIFEVRDWKDRLYAHRMGRVRRGGSSDLSSEDEDVRRGGQNKPNQFAPPPSYSFAPPPTFDADSSRPAAAAAPRRDPQSPAGIPDDPSGEDAYARRLRLSQQQKQPQSAPPPSSPSPPPAPLALPSAPQPPTEISRAPVRYSPPPPPPPSSLPPNPTEQAPPTDDTDAPRSSRPGQTGFAERILSRYGWKHGTGLGATASGITAPLRVQVEKAKRKSDAEGGGLRNPGGARGRIIGGKRLKAAETDAEGWSEVVRLRGMLKGVNIDAELREGEGGGVVQEIGDECGEKYGRVERVFVHRTAAEDNEEGPVVFVRFTSTLSAVRAVKALEGRAFGGNVIRAGFWGVDSFEDGVYE